MPEPVKKSFVILAYLVLTLVTLLVFWRLRNFGFIGYDDNKYVYENPHVLTGLTEDSVTWAFTTTSAANWHPLTWLSLMLDCQLFGADPGRIHLMNLIFHLANTLLLFAVLRKMTGALWPSAFVATAFAIHPMHVESVAWIAERKDVLSTLFLLLTLAAYIGYVRRPSFLRYIVVFVTFALGLMAKPMLVTLPFLLLLLDYWPLRRISISKRRLILEKIPLFALSAISSGITFLVQRASGAVSDFNLLPLQSRIANAFLSYTKYIGKMFWPQKLSVFYPFHPVTILSWQVLLSILLLIVVSVLVVWFGRKQKYLLTGWFWFLGTLLPVIGLVQVGGQALADRYTYVPYIGLFIILAWGLPDLLSRLPQRKIALGLSMVIALTALIISSYRQVSYWKNSFTLFSHAVEVTQNNYIAYNCLGSAYSKLGKYQDAVNAHKQAICIKPDYAKAHNNLGVAYYNLGRYEDAIESYKQAILLEPDYADAYYNLGLAYCKLKRYQDAIEPCKKAIKIKPDFALAHYNLGLVYFLTGDKNSALEEYKILKTLAPAKADELLKQIND